MGKWIKIMLTSALVFFFALIIIDNVAHWINKGDNSLVEWQTSYRHAAFINAVHEPPIGYQRISEGDLFKLPVAFRTDQYGAVLPYGGSGPCKVLFVGGSTTESHWMPEENRWPTAVGNDPHLRDSVTTMNFGVGGYNARQSLLRYVAVGARIRAHIVVVSHSVNDLSKQINGGYEAQETSLHNLADKVAEEDFKRRILSSLARLFPAMYTVYRRWTNQRTTFKPRLRESVTSGDDGVHGVFRKDLERWAGEFHSTLELFAEAIRLIGAVPVLMTQPNRSKELLESEDHSNPARRHLQELLEQKKIAPQMFIDGVEMFNDTIRNVSAQKSVFLIDLAREYERRDEHMYDTIHFTPSGSAAAANVIASRLEGNLSDLCMKRPE